MVSNTQLVSTLEADGRLIVELREEQLPDPTGHQVLVRIEAAPINPSDLGLLFGPADIATAEYTPGRIVATMPEGAVRAMHARVGQALPVGNEGAGTVIAAGDAALRTEAAPSQPACASRTRSCNRGSARHSNTDRLAAPHKRAVAQAPAVKRSAQTSALPSAASGATRRR